MITYVIIGITVIVSYICFGNHELFRKLAFIPYRTVHNKEWYRLVTHGFVHADMTHLLVNMFTFWSFGTYMERAFGYLGFGTGGYLGLYFGGMVAASLYDLILAYERADWAAINRLGEALGLPMDRLPEIYFQCLDDVNNVWRQLIDSGDAADG